MTSLAMIEQTAGKAAARAESRRRRRRGGPSGGGPAGGFGADRRPRPRTYIILSLVLLLSLAPLYYTVLLASSTAESIAQNPIPSIIPEGHLLENLQRVLSSDINFWGAFANSVIVSVVTSVSVVFFATLAGFSFSKLSFRWRGGLLAFIIGTMAIPPQLSAVPLFIVMSELGWTGDLKAVIVPALVTAFGVFWMTQYMQSALPYELIESARVDGCSMFRTFWHVGIPAARGAASVLALFTFVTNWTAFFWPSIVLGASNPTLPVALQLLQATYFKDYSLIMAGVLTATVPLIVLFVLTGRQLVAGIMQGAVKG